MIKPQVMLAGVNYSWVSHPANTRVLGIIVSFAGYYVLIDQHRKLKISAFLYPFKKDNAGRNEIWVGVEHFVDMAICSVTAESTGPY